MNRRHFLTSALVATTTPLLLPLRGTAAPRSLKVSPIINGIRIEFNPGLVGSTTRLWRSFTPLTKETLKDSRAPLTLLAQGPELKSGSFVDRSCAEGIYYSYLLCDSGLEARGEGALDQTRLPKGRHPDLNLRADKKNYVLEVWSGSRLLKRYALNFGKTPKVRKLHQDGASTPEGRYTLGRIYGKHQFHKAIDIDYPNEVDRARYQLASPGRSIGGEIQIHGEGLGRNFTFGCLAMDNADIDELVALPGLSGCPLWLYGGELTFKDLAADEAYEGDLSPLEIGMWQQDEGLPVTCLRDVATQRRGLQ